MNNFWSKKVQSSGLLYYSRAERFNDENKDFWFKALKVKDGMKVLEVGCGGGHYTNMIKKYFPNCEVYGIDLDENHIAFAKEKAKELNLDVKYEVADINLLPYKDEEFDLVFSNTVVEHIPFDNFIKEQRRVLKKGGNLVIIRVDMHKKVDRPFIYLEEEIGLTFDKLIINEANSPSVAKYLEEPDLTMQHLNEYGFKNIKFDYERVIYYTPDTQQDIEIAKKQIERNYNCKLYNALFILSKAENENEIKGKLLLLLKNQYEKRLKMLENNEKIYDFQSSNTIVLSALK